MTERERLTLAGLWSVPGIGVLGLRRLRERFSDLDEIAGVDPREWLNAVRLPPGAKEALCIGGTVLDRGDWVYSRAATAEIDVIFPGDAAWPVRLDDIRDAPPMLFIQGPANLQKRVKRVAMVGTRKPSNDDRGKIVTFAMNVAAAGIGIVSGAAIGVDQLCHSGALEAGEETWAVLGSALDEVDSGQCGIVAAIRARGGTVFSEFPPGVRASTRTFPRRNRLISGLSDAVLVVRAGKKSGTRHTVQDAQQQGRPLLAMPGDFDDPSAEYCNDLIDAGEARSCRTPQRVLSALGIDAEARAPRVVAQPLLKKCSERALAVLPLLPTEPRGFDEILHSQPSLDAGTLAAALVELELAGKVSHEIGRRYVRL